jgi:3-deoxy-D-manno-octulosonate 8-phosphate phosphatase (KDO 8-P phosphatase)
MISTISKIKMFVMDVDGTLTDGKLYIGPDGEIMKAFNIKDGQGIVNLLVKGIIPVIVTARKSKIVHNRAKKLGIIEVWQGVSDKIFIIGELARKYKLSFREIAYIGDDDNDIICMEKTGLSFAPADCSISVSKCANIILSRNGGDGAVREAIDIILENAN